MSPILWQTLAANAIGCWGWGVWAALPASAAYPVNPSQPLRVENAELNPPSSEVLDVSPTLLEESPVLRRWLEDIPDVWADIADDPGFPTRVRWGYVRWMEGDADGWEVGIEDAFLARSGLTLSGSYVRWGDADRAVGADWRYYLLSLGGSDLSISQTWIAPLSDESASLTTLSVAYAIARHLRLSTDLQRLNGEGQIGIFMEWMP
ncbi:MAG TPA: hypothetical protein IGS17_19510 [Oscillatoriales cyanobacterium M59_W2019_021]|nr:hypothetical protein [Oscillatoriales cyanobacterium M4454_W2019_049]HIK53087.1 hypothetical protein [Oscillatoriales cyanobacterium M59_W2019_021]